MNVPGRAFEGFNAAAVVMVHGYKELGKEARMQVYEIVNRETNKLGDKALQYYLDDSNGIRFARGNLYRLTRTEKRETARLLLSAPLSILKVVKTDTEMKIAYEFAGQLSTATVKDLVTHVSVNMKSTRDANKTLAELLYKYAKDQENKGQIETEHDSIYIDSGIVKVSYNTNLIDIKRTLKSLREFWPMSANPHAFISGLAYNLVAPLAYHIRTNSPPGYLFPIRISFGRTGGAKTSTDAIFVIKGFDQDKDAGFLTNEQVSTPFTFEKNMADSTLPVIINDVSPDWLFRVSTILKNSSENPTAGDRGNPDQSITRRRIKRALNITSNEAIVPSDDAARARRYILEEYTEEHVKRRNPYAFQNFMDSFTFTKTYVVYGVV